MLPPSSQPLLSELFAQFLAEDFPSATSVEDGEVELYQAAPAGPPEPQAAWQVAVVALGAAPEVAQLAAPPSWSTLVRQADLSAVAFCVGNYPQMVRSLQPLFVGANRRSLAVAAGRALELPELTGWATDVGRRGAFPEVFAAAGALRLARQYAQAEAVLGPVERVPTAWRAAWANEAAALAWHAGRLDEAAEQWRRAPESVPVLFNRGLSELFVGSPTAASDWLTRATAALAESDPWHHLGQMYLALAEFDPPR